MQLGTVEGKVNTSSFEFRAVEEVKKFDFVSIKSNNQWILCQVDEVTKHPDGETIANANIIGYREKGLTKAPRTVIEPDSIVYQADQELISDTLGLDDEGLQIGSLETNPEIDIHVNAEDFYKHFAVLAQTGAGKSYLTGVIIEELLENDFPVLIVDPHGEYHSLGSANPDSDNPDSYPVTEYSPNTDINNEAMPLRFSSLNMDKKELTTLIPDSLTNSQMGVLYNALKRLKEKDDGDYSLIDIEDAVTQEDSTAKWNLLNYLEQLEETNLFSKDPIDLENLVEPGEASIINLKAVEPDASEMTVYMLAQKLFNMRKENKIPPFIMILEEAHNYVPEKGFGQALSNPIMRKIASEGRKFGVGIGVISQRPARIDKNVLSQANTQFILRVTNPNDLKAISKSFEGITSEIEDMITSLPPGVAFSLGNEYPVMTDVRTRKSLHGGETQTNESYVPQETIEIFKPNEDIQKVRSNTGKDYDEAYYPIYWVEDDEGIKLVDGVNGKVKAERDKLSGKHEMVFQHLKEDRSKQEIMEEMDVGISRIASIIEELQSRGFLDSDKNAEESIIDHEKEEKQVEEEALIDIEVDERDIEGAENADVKLVRYPYFSKGDEVYDPILEKHL
ncbi:MAG: DNA helicase HerA-like ATPase [Candidatus Nanohaloarchaea archaeon]|jgi:DNA helicase HerA-like ATPase